MKQPIRTMLARYESRLLADLGQARAAERAARRRVTEIETEIKNVRVALHEDSVARAQC